MPKKPSEENDYDDYQLDDMDELTDDEFFEEFTPREDRKKSRSRKDARRRIENYWEERELASRLDEYYLHPD